jgi:hypothetical protein
MERLTQYGKPGKKAQAAPAATKPRKSEERKSEASEEPPVAEAA